MTGRVSVREAEVRALTLWVEPSCRALGDWVLRTVAEAPGLGLPRTNSCLAVGDPGVPLAEAIDDVLAFYAALERPALVRVEVGSAVEATFLGAGWRVVPGEESSFHVADLAVALAGALTGVGPPPPAATSSRDGTRLLAVLAADGDAVGRVRGELNQTWLGVHGLHVDERRRRRGHGRSLMAALLAGGAAAGAGTAWLEVADDHAPALALYARLGFRQHHACRYLTASV